MNHKKSIIAVMVFAVIASSLYTIYELRPPTAFSTGSGQYQNLTYEEMVEKHRLIIHGKITNVETVIVVITSEEEDYEIPPNIISVLTEKVPKQKLSVDIIEVYKDTFGIEPNSIIVYDRADGIGENYESERTLFSYDETYHHKVGDEGLFFISQQDGMWDMSGYSTYYPIIDGKTTVTTELDKHRQKAPIDIDTAKNKAKDTAKSNQ